MLAVLLLAVEIDLFICLFLRMQVFYQLTLRAQPSDALYEATVKHILPETGDAGDGKFSLDMRDISRINRYGSQADCIASRLPHLRPYCFCHRNSNARIKLSTAANLQHYRQLYYKRNEIMAIHKWK